MSASRFHLPLGVAALVALWWKVRLVGPGRVPAVSDLTLYFIPLYRGFYERAAMGRLPLWNPFQLCGIPWLATVQGGFLYPPHGLYVFLPTGVALAVSGMGHLLLVGVSMAALARAVGVSGPAAALPAILFTLRGTTPGLLPWPCMLEAAAWLPLGSLGVLGIARGEGRRAVALLALATGGSLLAGFPQMTVFLGYAWGGLLLAMLFGGGAAPRRWAAASGSFAGALTLGGLLAAAALLPAMEMVWVATRPARVIPVERMFPFGNPGLLLERNALAGSDPLFGVLGVALAPAALLARRHRALAVWALSMGTLAFLFALGPLTPLFPIYLALPAVGTFRDPNRILILADFAFALLAGMGLDALARDPGGTDPTPEPPPSRRLIVGLSIATALLISVLLALRGARLPALVAAGTAMVLLVGTGARTAGLPWAIIAFAVLETLPSSRGAGLPYAAAADPIYRRYADTFTTLATSQGSDRVWVLKTLPVPELGPKLATLYRVRTVEDYEDVNLKRQAEYFTFAMEGVTVSRETQGFYQGRLSLPPAHGGPSPLALRRRLLDLAAVRLIAIHESLLRSPDVRAFVEQAGLMPVRSLRQGMRLFENPRALPRAFVVYRTRPAPPPDLLLDHLSDRHYDPLAVSYVEGDPGFVATPDAPARGTPATFVRDEDAVVELDATLAAPGLLVLADSFYTGWRATVDGVPAPILATNHLFRGVPVPAGRHRVRFEYRPWTVPVGMFWTCMAALVLLFLVPPRRAARAR